MASEPEPRREQILQRVVSLLEAIPARSPDRFPIVRVERTWRPIESCNEFPVYIVEPAGHGSTGSTLQLNAQTVIYRHDYRFTVYGYFRGDDETSVWTWIERGWDMASKQILSQPGLGGLVLRVDPEGPRELDMLAPDTGLAAFAQDWAADFNEDFPVAA
mgnify:CR=1 FL=1